MSLSLKGAETNNVVEFRLGQENELTPTVIFGVNGEPGVQNYVFTDSAISASEFSYSGFITRLILGTSCTVIGDSAFQNNANLAGALYIPDTVTTIGQSAFRSCPQFTSLKLPNNPSFTNIDNNCFNGCTNLTSITIPDNVTDIGVSAFSNCTNLTSITIPDSVTDIGALIFNGCSNLTSIDSYVDNSAWSSYSLTGSAVTTIHVRSTDPSWTAGASQNIGGITVEVIKDLYSAPVTITPTIFYDNNNNELVGRSITTDIPAGFTSAGQNLDIFYISIGTSCTSIGENAFNGSALKGDLIIPSTVTDLYNNCFRDCNALTSLTLNEGLININEGAFSLNEQFTNTVINIPNSVETIGVGAFFQCTSLTSITVGTGVQTIGQAAFYGCSNLTTFNCYVSKTIVDAATSMLEQCTALTEIHVRSTDSSWTAGAGQTIGGKTGITVIKDL